MEVNFGNESLDFNVDPDADELVILELACPSQPRV